MRMKLESPLSLPPGLAACPAGVVRLGEARA
jgi:hypothetical protein